MGGWFKIRKNFKHNISNVQGVKNLSKLKGVNCEQPHWITKFTTTESLIFLVMCEWTLDSMNSVFITREWFCCSALSLHTYRTEGSVSQKYIDFLLLSFCTHTHTSANIISSSHTTQPYHHKYAPSSLPSFSILPLLYM